MYLTSDGGTAEGGGVVSGLSRPDISVVIVSYKVPELLRACLESVQRETVGCSYEVVLVENASGDGSAELIAAGSPTSA